MNYIIDSCVWIDYFRNKTNFKEISQLLIDNLALTNKIILSELIPSAMANKEYDFIDESCLETSVSEQLPLKPQFCKALA
jgi:hypothetical protein